MAPDPKNVPAIEAPEQGDIEFVEFDSEFQMNKRFSVGALGIGLPGDNDVPVKVEAIKLNQKTGVIAILMRCTDPKRKGQSATLYRLAGASAAQVGAVPKEFSADLIEQDGKVMNKKFARPGDPTAADAEAARKKAKADAAAQEQAAAEARAKLAAAAKE